MKVGRAEDGRVDLDAGEAGRIWSMASSTPWVTSSVLPHGNFSTMSIRPGPSLMTASPIKRLVILDHRRHVAEAQRACRHARSIDDLSQVAGE